MIGKKEKKLQRWEYHTVHIDIQKGDDSWLSEQGEEGWELVSVVGYKITQRDYADPVNRDDFIIGEEVTKATAFLKRPILD